MKTPIELLTTYWGHSEFRPQQLEIIESVLAKNDTVALLPTGGGKSVCFQVPALLLEGVCVVITPLIALMKDQTEQLLSKGIKAAAIYSGLTKTEIDATLDSFIYDDFKFLYISPERLNTEILQVRIRQMNVSLLAIDEAHCVSQWGHDFRPSYLRIPDIKPLIPKATVIALTATATKKIREDITTYLGLKKPKVFTQSFARKNLSFSVFETELRDKKIIEILSKVEGSAIVYAKTRKRTIEITELLQHYRISADFYHGGLDNVSRFQKQENWIKNRTRVMVATNAFGMGIDKPDVRVVIHADMSENLEAYYQEAGRAGRDGQKSYAVALYEKADLLRVETDILKKYPPIETLKNAYQQLCNFYQIAYETEGFLSFEFDLNQFCTTFGLNSFEVHHSLKLLENQEIITLSDAFYSPSRIKILIDNKDLYNFYIKSPTHEKLLKTLLRIYGGEILGNYLKISENEIARLLFSSEFELRTNLKYLHEVGVLDYQPQRNKPILSFLGQRYDAQKLPLKHASIEEKKKAELFSAQKVTQFLTEKRRCRMVLLQEYFDDFDDKTCGICDNCLQRKKGINLPTNEAEIERYKAKIMEILPAEVMKLTSYIFFQDVELLKEALRKLLEEQKILITELGVIERKLK